jgi:hypothetical protein
MVEIFCGDENDGNITGAPIRMESTRKDGSSVLSMWTCGGVIRVDGSDYGLTTAHPHVLSNSTKDISVDDGPFGGKDDFFSAEQHPEKYWQPIGKVSHYALAKTGSIPSNYDWLLFELPKERSLWNDFESYSDPDALAVFTARGTLSAHILEGTAFLVLGNSPFEVLKIGLQQPLRKNSCVHHRNYRSNVSQDLATPAPGSCAVASSSE